MGDFVLDLSKKDAYGRVRIGDAEYEIRGVTRPVARVIAEKQREAARLRKAELDGTDEPTAEVTDHVARLMIETIDAHLRAPEGAPSAAAQLLELWHQDALTVDHHLTPMLEHLRRVAT